MMQCSSVAAELTASYTAVHVICFLDVTTTTLSHHHVIFTCMPLADQVL